MRILAWLIVSLVMMLSNPRLYSQQAVSAQVLQGWKLWSEGKPKAAIAVLEPLVQPNRPMVSGADAGLAWNVMGSSWQDLQFFDKAQQCYETAIRVVKPLASHQSVYASAIANLGATEEALGQLSSAKGLYKRSLHIYEKLGDHSGITIASDNLAILALQQQDFEAGRRWFARTVEEARLATGLRADDFASMHSVEGTLDIHDGRFPDAISAFRQAIGLWTRAYGSDFFGLAAGYSLLARAEAKNGNLADASLDIRHALAIIDTTVGRNTVTGIQVQMIYAQVLRASGSRGEASYVEKQSKKALLELEQRQCSGCTINVESFR